jgi:citrate synthase
MGAGGLDGVVVADTAMSHVDGEQGELWIRGFEVGALAERGRLEDAIAVLWDGEAPGPAGDRWVEELGRARVRMWPLLQDAPALAAPDGAVALRAGLAPLEGASPIELVAAAGMLVAGWSRARAGLPPLAPRADLDHAADLVRLLRGEPDPARARALGAYLCTVVDHGMNASTFAARVVASTGADPTSAVVAAVGALKGPLHGGAPGPVLDMLDAVGRPERAAAWIEAELRSGRRIMGMGHRIYRVRDPRVAVLEQAIEALGRAGVATERLALARAVEQAAEQALARAKPDRPLRANVEFATAVLLDAIGLDRSAFTGMFAAGRVVGWLAHVAEQRATGRLIRPASRYVGPTPNTR